jgi:hypothetical protein
MDEHNAYIVTDCNGDDHSFGDLKIAIMYMNSVILSVFQHISVEYDCIISSSLDGSRVFINGKERDRIGIYDRNLVSMSINPMFD